jgi:hypothetical protein
MSPKFGITERGELVASIAYPQSYAQCRPQNDLPKLERDNVGPDVKVRARFTVGDDLVTVAPTNALASAERTLAEHSMALAENAQKQICLRKVSYLIVSGRVDPINGTRLLGKQASQ